MSKAFEKAKHLIAVNARHRKGFLIGNQDAALHLVYCLGELGELQSAEACADREAGPITRNQTRYDQLHELADCLNCLMLYAGKKGFAEEEIEAAQVHKLDTRFTEEK